MLGQDAGVYVYAVIPWKTSEHRAALTGLLGFEDREVVAVSVGDIAAVTSVTSIDDFTSEGEVLRRSAALHQRVNQALLKNTTVVPLAFGTVAETEQDVRTLLSRASLQLALALQKAEEHHEFVLQGTWDDQRFIAHLIATDEEVGQAQAALTKGLLPLRPLAKIKLGKLVFDKLQQARQDQLTAAVGTLFAPSEAIVVEPPRDDQCFNISVLIRRSEESALDTVVQEMADQLGDWIAVKYIGPLPLNSFLHLNIKATDYQTIDAAQSLLGLPEVASRKEIQAAYWQQAALHHPDKHAASGDSAQLLLAAQSMEKLNAAYAALVLYCDHAPDAAEHSFRRQDVEQRLTIQPG
jgi:DnaJ-domain-containing protein 1